jgi:tetratricopeptide (TPR) repeat protein
MRNVKLFLASGNALKKDRDAIMLFLANKNQFLVKHGIFLELVRWEFLSSSFSETRKQDDFNKALEESEIFTCLIFDRIGQYTREEFDKAYQNYKQGKNPKKFYLYFKTLSKNKKEEAIDVYEFRKAIEKDEQIYREYKNPDQLKLFINENLDLDLPEILKQFIQYSITNLDSVPETQNVPEYILDNLDDADKMLNKKLTRNAKEIYEESLKQISKHTQRFLYAKVKRNLAKCNIDLACERDDEENQIQKAIVYLEEVLQIFDPSIHSEELAQTYIHIGEGYNWLAFFREKKENIFKAIEATKKAIDILKNIPKSPLYINPYTVLVAGIEN